MPPAAASRHATSHRHISRCMPRPPRYAIFSLPDAVYATPILFAAAITPPPRCRKAYAAAGIFLHFRHFATLMSWYASDFTRYASNADATPYAAAITLPRR